MGEAGKEVDYTYLKCIPRKFTGVWGATKDPPLIIGVNFKQREVWVFFGVLCGRRQCNFSLVFTFAEFLLKIVEKTPPSPVKEINWAKYPINKMEERRRKSKVKECMRKPQMCSSFSPFDFSSSRSPTFTFIYHFLSTLLQVFDRFLVITDTWNPHQHVDASNCSGTRPKWKPSSLCPRIYFVIVLQMNQNVGIS